MKIHPNDILLEEFLLSLSLEQQSLLEHLTRCSVCRARLRYLPRSMPTGLKSREEELGEVSSYGGVFDKLAGRIERLSLDLARERDAAPGLYVELTEIPVERRALLLANSQRFQTWGLYELLVERSLEVTIHDSQGAEALARLALQLSDYLDSERYGLPLIMDLRTRTWAHIANARRIRSDFEGAEEAFAQARAHLNQGTKDPLEEAILLDLQASLLRDQRRFQEAIRLLRRGIDIFLKSGELHRGGRSLVNLSTIHNYAGAPDQAAVVLYRAIELIDPEQEPRLLLCARHNLTFVLADLNRFTEAWELYREARQLYRQFPDAWTQNRRRWVKGKITYGLGQLGQAESLFLAARDGFLAEGIPYDTALVSLEIALLYAEQWRMADLKRLAAEIVPIFTSRQIHREALAALGFLRQAVEAERASLDVVAGVSAFLRRAQHDPELRFEEPA